MKKTVPNIAAALISDQTVMSSAHRELNTLKLIVETPEPGDPHKELTGTIRIEA